MTDTLKLTGKRVTLVISGGIAAVKIGELVRRLSGAGAEIRVVLTRAGLDFCTPLSLRALGAREVWGPHETGPSAISHISLGQQTDLVLIAPATANLIAKAAHGIADDLASSTIVARSAPLALCPAMNVRMWLNPANQRNVEQLRRDGALIWGPDEGPLACGVSALGRMISPADIADRVAAALAAGPLRGHRAVVTAGATMEDIDPVRFLSNRSSGRQGVAVARALLAAGAEVTLIAAQLRVAPPAGARLVEVRSARQMLAAVLEHAAQADILVGVAAVSDWTPVEPSARKLKKEPGQDRLALTFERNPDIIATARERYPRALVIGFAAETEDHLAHARRKLAAKKLDLMLVNPVPEAFGAERSRVTVVGPDDFTLELGERSKDEVAEALARLIAERLPASGQGD